MAPFRIGSSAGSAKRTAPGASHSRLPLWQSETLLRLCFLPSLVFLFPVTMPTRNPTGFDIGQFKAAASPSSVYAKRDPWARQYV